MMKKLADLKVAKLKEELEKRDLDKNGVKAILQERLQQALEEEGHDPETYCFDSESSEAFINEGHEEDDQNDESANMENDEEVAENGGDDVEPVEDDEANEKEDEQIVMVNEEEMGEFDCEKPKEKKKGGMKGKGACPSKSPPRPDSVPVVVPFTSKDTIELASSLKPSSDDASLIVNVDDQSVRDENVSQNGNLEDGKKEESAEQGTDGSTTKKSEDSATKSSHSTKTETKEKDKKQQSSPNLWVSGLASTTRATDLKQIFSKYGKVSGAKVVTNARTPGSRCYGFVTMASTEEASRCIQHLHRTELHGRMISVERAKTEPSVPQKKKEEKKVTETEKSEVKKEAPSTEKEKEHRKPINDRHTNRKEGENKERSAHRGHKDVLSFDKIKEERERQKLREQERHSREEARRQREERNRLRARERRHMEEKNRMEREKRELRMERDRLEREKMELLKMQKEQTRIERRRIEKEKEQLLREHRRLSEPKRKRSPDFGYDDRKRSRFPGSRDSHRSREKEDLKLKLERERFMRRRSPDERRVVERSRLDRYKDEVSGRWPPSGGSMPKAPGMHHPASGDAKWGASSSWGGRLGGSAPVMGSGGWGPSMGSAPPGHLVLSHHGMGVTSSFGSTQAPTYPVMRRY